MIKKNILYVVILFAISGLFVADARLVSGIAQHQHDSTSGGGATLSAPTFTATNPQFSGKLTVSNTNPHLCFNETDAAGSNQQWAIVVGGENFRIATSPDGIGSCGVSTTLIEIPRATLNIRVTRTLESTKACASGYTRVSPNICKRDLPIATTNLSTGCTSVTIPSSDAKAVLVYAEVNAISANVAAATRFSQLDGSTGTTCTGFLLRTSWIARGHEFNAVAGTTLSSYYAMQWALVSANFGLNFTRDGGNQSTAAYAIVAYMD